MDTARQRRVPERKDDRVIIHFDYDCFYASVFEAENPALKSLPLAVQQKQIIVTCNYEARRRGLYKLQLITEAKRICPDVIIVLGEDISRFRDASKELYRFLASYSWSKKVERLGFDEVWFDVTDAIEYNISLLNSNSLDTSFFQLVKDDPTSGFAFDAGIYAGHTFPANAEAVTAAEQHDAGLSLRLKLGSHLAMHMRHELEHHKGYTATVGISTNKLLSKLVGNLNKPKGQTTLLPPYNDTPHGEGNAISFLDGHDIGKVPNIGFKTAQKLREHVLNRTADFSTGLVYGGTKEAISVRDVRLFPDLNALRLDQLLAGPGTPHNLGIKVWNLLHGIDDSEVSLARAVPRQISLEDSYIRLDTLPEVVRELTSLAKSLLTRMKIDLLSEDSEDEHKQKWLAHPRTLRLSTRPRPPLNPDGTRTRTFKRISASAPLPTFVFGLIESEAITNAAERLVHESLIPLFKRLHPGKSGWNLSLVNVAVTNMVESGGEERGKVGRDIGGMFKRQEDVLSAFRVVEEVDRSDGEERKEDDIVKVDGGVRTGSEGEVEVEVDRKDELKDEFKDVEGGHKETTRWKGKGKMVDFDEVKNEQEVERTLQDDGEDEQEMERMFQDEDGSELEDDEADDAIQSVLEGEVCATCGIRLPSFALPAHERFHQMGGD